MAQVKAGSSDLASFSCLARSFARSCSAAEQASATFLRSALTMCAYFSSVEAASFSQFAMVALKACAASALQHNSSMLLSVIGVISKVATCFQTRSDASLLPHPQSSTHQAFSARHSFAPPICLKCVDKRKTIALKQCACMYLPVAVEPVFRFSAILDELFPDSIFNKLCELILQLTCG